MRLEGKTAIITGAAAGFGEGMARRFAQEGAKVVIADLDINGAERVAADIGSAAVAIKTDVTRMQDNQAMAAAAMELGGAIDIFILNAGCTHPNGPMLDVDEEMFDRVSNVNMKALFYASKCIVPQMEKQGGGSILATASTAGLRPRPGLVWYNASKAWVINACKCMAVELAPKNIRVNSLCPVAGETQMLKDFMGEDTPEIREKFKSVIPLGRFSQPRDLANAALYLVSDEADFITGVALEVDGGRCV